MQAWNLRYFKDNTKKLKIYLKSTENAIIIINLNDLQGVHEFTNMLKLECGFQLLDYASCNENLVWTLQEYSRQDFSNHLCLFNIQVKPDNYDAIRTLNVARELLRQIGFVILILPNYLAERVRRDVPDLASYIRADLNYNMEYPNCIKFQYSEEYRFYESRKERSDRKAWIRNNIKQKELKNSIERYYNDLDRSLYHQMSEQDIYDMLDLLLFDIREFKEDTLEAALYKKTAELFVKQGYLKEAELLYDELISLANRRNMSLHWIEGMQGKAYCLYCKEEYAESEKLLHETLVVKDQALTDLWKCKLYSDYGVCVYYTKGYQQAYMIWERCKTTLLEMDGLHIHRHFRLLYNMVLATTKSGGNIHMIAEEWNQLKEKIDRILGRRSREYCLYLLLDSWLCMQQGRLYQANMQMEQAYACALDVFPENDEYLIIANYVWAVIVLQMGELHQAESMLERGRNILNNRKQLKSKYDTFFAKSQIKDCTPILDSYSK